MIKGPRSPIFIDTETTGFAKDGGSEELIQFAAVKENGATLSRFFLPSGPISDSAVRTHDWTMEKLEREGAVPFSSADAKEILEFAGPRALVVMHNKWFDPKVLLKAFKAAKVHLPLKDPSDPWETRCTQELAKQLGQPETLDELCSLFDVERPQKHDALADASATM